ncbi:unnamed protein product, partial [Ectocarpus sp. 12 AP-2014]
MRRSLIALALATLPLAAQAQDWATFDVCTVETPKIVETAFAPATLSSLETRGADLANGKGRLWRIETPQGSISHLWGTLHSADPLILDLPQVLRNIIDSARLVAVEIDFTAKSRAALREA